MFNKLEQIQAGPNVGLQLALYIEYLTVTLLLARPL